MKKETKQFFVVSALFSISVIALAIDKNIYTSVAAIVSAIALVWVAVKK